MSVLRIRNALGGDVSGIAAFGKESFAKSFGHLYDAKEFQTFLKDSYHETKVQSWIDELGVYVCTLDEEATDEILAATKEETIWSPNVQTIPKQHIAEFPPLDSGYSVPAEFTYKGYMKGFVTVGRCDLPCKFKWLLLYTVGIFFPIKWCIRQLYSSSVIPIHPSLASHRPIILILPS